MIVDETDANTDEQKKERSVGNVKGCRCVERRTLLSGGSRAKVVLMFPKPTKTR